MSQDDCLCLYFVVVVFFQGDSCSIGGDESSYCGGAGVVLVWLVLVLYIVLVNVVLPLVIIKHIHVFGLLPFYCGWWWLWWSCGDDNNGDICGYGS